MVSFVNFYISSKDNAKIKYVKKLTSNARFRKSEKKFVIEGIRLAYDAFLNNVVIKEVYYTESVKNKFSDKLRSIIDHAEHAYKISDNILPFVSCTQNPQGIVCVCEKLDKHFDLNKIISVRRFIILENIQDPANVGAILRTADALGINFIFMSSNCCDIYNSKVLRASMGAIFRVNISFFDDFSDVATKLKSNNVKILAAILDKSAKLINKVNFKDIKSIAIAIGNEGNGLLKQSIALCDECVTIPMCGNAESLNAAMAAGILMWEMMRETRK